MVEAIQSPGGGRESPQADHKLVELAKQAISRPPLANGTPGDPADVLRARILRVAKDLEVLDPGSDRFRYPVDRRGQAPDNRDRVDLRRFRLELEGLLADLEAVNSHLVQMSSVPDSGDVRDGLA